MLLVHQEWHLFVRGKPAAVSHLLSSLEKLSTSALSSVCPLFVPDFLQERKKLRRAANHLKKSRLEHVWHHFCLVFEG